MKTDRISPGKLHSNGPSPRPIEFEQGTVPVTADTNLAVVHGPGNGRLKAATTREPDKRGLPSASGDGYLQFCIPTGGGGVGQSGKVPRHLHWAAPRPGLKPAHPGSKSPHGSLAPSAAAIPA